MKRILITGGDGFLGKSLHEYLSSQFVIISKNKSQLNILDSLKVLNFLKKNKFDTVIHTATYAVPLKYSRKNPDKILENNLMMFFNLARCKDYFGELIYFGSGAEFNRDNWVPKMKEGYFDKFIPTDQYGFSKYIMTKYTYTNKRIINLRLFGIYGKYDDWRYRFIPNSCKNVIFNQPIQIMNNARFDYMYIDDLCRIVKWFIINKCSEKVYNVCTGTTYELKTIGEKIIKTSKKDLEIKFGYKINKNQKGDQSIYKSIGKEYSGDNSLLMNELGNFKFTLIDDSIRDLYNWYQINKKLVFD